MKYPVPPERRKERRNAICVLPSLRIRPRESREEFARIPLLEGKSWNHPMLIGDLLLVRNDRQIVALRLPTAKG